MITTYSHRTTPDIIEDFVDIGYSYEQAHEYALNYVENPTNFQMAYIDFVETFDSDNNLPPFDDTIENEEEPQLGINYGVLKNMVPKVFRAGASYNGIYDIKEKETERCYIPSSYYCILKCFKKCYSYYGIDLELPTKNINPYGISLKKARKLVISYLTELGFNLDKINESLPLIYKLNADTNNFSLSRLSHRTIKTSNPYTIVLIPFTLQLYHAIVLKVPRKEAIYKDFSLDFFTDKSLTIDFTHLRPPSFKICENIIIVYDIETYIYLYKKQSVVKGSKQLIETKQLIPYSLTYSIVNLSTKTFTEPKLLTRTHYLPNNISDVFDLFFIELDEKLRNKLIPSVVQIFAHNGGVFDNIYVKSVINPMIQIKNMYSKSKNIKYLEVDFKAGKYIFKDSMSFILMSLKDACNNFKCENKKLDFDIKDKTLDWFLQTNEWVHYALQDVRCLAELLIKVESMYLDLGESITTSTTLPSLAWRLLSKTCYSMKNLYIPKHPSIIKFIKDSIYGGRILHWKKLFNHETENDVLVSLDGNSLFPSTMYSSCFPLGIPKVLNEKQLKNFKFDEYPHYIIEIEVIPSNTRYPLHPFKDEKGTLLYKTERFTGVYNDVDVKEMLTDGYTITKVIRGIYWVMSERIFTDLINYLYNFRKELKIVGDPKEYILKILLNAQYGKFLEIINTVYTFKEKTETMKKCAKKIKLINGQSQYKFKLEYPIIKKPLYIGSYVLSYARKIMNELIREVVPENIWYSDTDSIYVKKSAITNVKINNELCGFKNDYGEGQYIKYAIFLDIKKYFLEFEDNTVKIRFAGLNFKDIDEKNNI